METGEWKKLSLMGYEFKSHNFLLPLAPTLLKSIANTAPKKCLPMDGFDLKSLLSDRNHLLVVCLKYDLPELTKGDRFF